jgi:hypothetical protein
MFGEAYRDAIGGGPIKNAPLGRSRRRCQSMTVTLD